jgi:hypothetical protein
MGCCWYIPGRADPDRYLQKLQVDAGNINPSAECLMPPLCPCSHPGMANHEGLVRISILQNLLEAIKIYGGEPP